MCDHTFRTELLEIIGFEDDPKADMIFNLACDLGSEGGKSAIIHWAISIACLVTENRVHKLLSRNIDTLRDKP